MSVIRHTQTSSTLSWTAACINTFPFLHISEARKLLVRIKDHLPGNQPRCNTLNTRTKLSHGDSAITCPVKDLPNLGIPDLPVTLKPHDFYYHCSASFALVERDRLNSYDKFCHHFHILMCLFKTCHLVYRIKPRAPKRRDTGEVNKHLLNTCSHTTSS